jgi:hypothetical protein
MLKKFRENDIYINRVRAYPKVEFFVNSGSVNSVYYNRIKEPQGLSGSQDSGFVYLNRIINPLLTQEPIDAADFDEGFEFGGGWDETVADVPPTPGFTGSVNFNEPFEFAGSWDETIADVPPTPGFTGSVNFNEPFDTAWDGTPAASGSLLAENSDPLITEGGDNIVT